MQKIKTELFDNKFYIVKGVNNKANIQFVDLQKTSSQQGQISPQIFTKNIQLHRLDIPVSINANINDLQETYILYNHIKNEINKEYFKLITELGEKNRIDAPMNHFDISITKLKEIYPNHDIGKIIISKFISSSNYIATEGRIGPARWITSNNKTYKYILDNLLDSTYLDNNLLIGNIPYIINDAIDDDIILLGRKNTISQPGVFCTILTDENGYIIIQEHFNYQDYNPGIYQKTLSIYYSVDEIGFNPKTQFLKLNTKSLGYYRAKKLQRIKELYGE